MRAVFPGGGALPVMTDSVLLNRAHEVIIIEQDKDRIDVLSDEFACGFIRSDGSKPAILRETDPRDVDFPDQCRIICLYRNGKFKIPDSDLDFRTNGEVVVLTHSRNLGLVK
jgi:Trk K+ transport system NAD-binding subunit